MLPGSEKSPFVSFPEIFSGSPPAVSTDTPCCGSSSAYTPIGRCGSLPCPMKIASMPSAAKIGIRKRSVEPDSPQSTVTAFVGASPGVSFTTPSVKSACTPIARMPASVAYISALVSIGDTVHGALPSAAQSSARCAALLLGGMRTLPATRAGRYVTSAMETTPVLLYFRRRFCSAAILYRSTR